MYLNHDRRSTFKAGGNVTEFRGIEAVQECPSRSMLFHSNICSQESGISLSLLLDL